MAIVADELLLRVRSDITQAVGGLNTVQRKVGSMVASTSTDLTKLGKAFTKKVTLPILGIGGASAVAASQFEDYFAKMRGLIGEQADDWEMLRQGVLRLAGADTRRAPRELADALFFIESAGFRGQAALDILETSGKAAAAGLGDTKVVADLLTSALFAFNRTGADAERTMDAIVAAAREGKAEPAEFAGAMGRLLPIGAALGIEFEELASQMALMTKSGDSTQEAATKIRAAMAAALKPIDASQQALERFGLSADDVLTIVREQGMTALLETLSARMDELGLSANDQVSAWAELFPNVRALGGVLQQVGGQAENARNVLDSVTNSTGSLNEAFDATMTTSEQFAILKGNIEKVAISFGDALLPALANIAEGLSNVLIPVGEFVSQHGEVIAQILTFAAVVGPAVWAAGKLAAGVKLVAGSFKLAAMAGGGGLFGSLKTLASFAFNPLTLAVGAGVAAFAVWNRTQQRAAERADALKQTLDGVTGSVTEQTRQWVQAELEAKGALGTLNDLGVSTADLNEMLQSGVGLPRLIEELDKYWVELRKTSGAEHDAAKAKTDLQDALRELQRAYREGSDDSFQRIRDNAMAAQSDADYAHEAAKLAEEEWQRQQLRVRQQEWAKSKTQEQKDAEEKALAEAAKAWQDYADKAAAEQREIEQKVQASVAGIVSLFDGAPKQLKISLDKMWENLRETAALATQFEKDLALLAAAGLTGLEEEFRSKGPETAKVLHDLVTGDFAQAFDMEAVLSGAVPGAFDEVEREMNAKKARLENFLRLLGMDAGAAWAAGFNLNAVVNTPQRTVPGAGNGYNPVPRSFGGTFQAGQFLKVGERGPELVKFDKGGTVVPNEQMKRMEGAGSSPASVGVLNVNVGFPVDEREQRKIVAAIDQAMSRYKGEARWR